MYMSRPLDGLRNAQLHEQCLLHEEDSHRAIQQEPTPNLTPMLTLTLWTLSVTRNCTSCVCCNCWTMAIPIHSNKRSTQNPLNTRTRATPWREALGFGLGFGFGFGFIFAFGL